MEVGACRHYLIFLLVIPGHVARKPTSMALIHVSTTGELHAPCKNLVTFSVLVLGTMQFASLMFTGTALSVDCLDKSMCYNPLDQLQYPIMTIVLLRHVSTLSV